MLCFWLLPHIVIPYRITFGESNQETKKNAWLAVNLYSSTKNKFMESKISPSVGVARLGNSNEYYLAPDQIGGLPYQPDLSGPVQNFKDDSGRVKKQGQIFKVYNDQGTEITLNTPGVTSIEWTVHLANKKAAWYQYSELKGNLLYGEENSYKKWGVDFRNDSVTDPAERQKLIIDAGPRTISGESAGPVLCDSSALSNYPHVSFPPADVNYGLAITSLGELRTDAEGRLIVFGGSGNAGGDEPLTSYGGSDTWHDDISDGPVYCTVTFTEGTHLKLKAWVIIGSPDFAPEIVNISTLSDTMFDVGVRHFNLVEDMCKDGIYNDAYVANFRRDILPIIQRISNYQWVANVQSMMAFVNNIWELTDPATKQTERKNFFSYFREPSEKLISQQGQPQQQLFKEDNSIPVVAQEPALAMAEDSNSSYSQANGSTQTQLPQNGQSGGLFPMMPLNSGSNSVSNDTVVKFLALDQTQYFLMKQWSEGKFENSNTYDDYPVDAKDQASVGNCVGLPMCPGIEVTWSLQNPKIYENAYRIKGQKDKGGYDATGLNPSRDECEGGDGATDLGGCQPGDLTKRMACPWQADFFQCTVQVVNFTNEDYNKAYNHTQITNQVSEQWYDSATPEPGKEIETLNFDTSTIEDPVNQPLPPAYYSYWWPPQSPWDVISGETSLEGQIASRVPAGQQMNYARGINNFVQMVEHWYALAFIRDQNAGQDGFPYFTETERNNDLFSYKELGVGSVSGNGADNETTLPVFYIEEDAIRTVSGKRSAKARKMRTFLEERAFKAIKVGDAGLGFPRSGTRNRR